MGLGVEFALTRTLRDTAALLDVLAPPAPGDPFVIPQPGGRYLGDLTRPTGPVRIGMIARSWTGLAIDRDAVRAVEHGAVACEALGHAVEETQLEVDPAVYARDVWAAHLALSCDGVAEETAAEISEATLEPVNLQAYRRGRELTAGAMLATLDKWNTIRRQVGALFERYDVLMTPTMNGAAALGAHGSTNQAIPYEQWTMEDAEDFPFTGLFNLTGTPAISLPLFESVAGLPIGVQFAGRFGDESTLLRLAAALESARPWSHRRPAVHVAHRDA
jgi:amidase